MSAKNSGATREQYEQYNKDKRKTGEPIARRVVLEVWKTEEKKPDRDTSRGKVVAWDSDGCFLMECDYTEVPFEPPYWMLDNGYTYPITDTSWAYIPNIKEATR